MIARNELTHYLNELLQIKNYDDYAPNGLQVEGTDKIKKIGFAVSATFESIQQSVDLKLDALIVHHGIFWKFHGPKTITEAFAKRVKPLIQNEINLLAYHLPLDAHLTLGNAAGLAKKIGLNELTPFGDHKKMPTGCQGQLVRPLKAKELALLLEKATNHKIILSTPSPDKMITSVGIITGGAANDWPLAKSAGLDAFITGEMSEYHWHEAKESDMVFLAAGHHATEVFGVLNLKEHLLNRYPDIECIFIDSENPA